MTKGSVMKDSGLMIRNMVLESIDFQTRTNMKACGMRIFDMEMAHMILAQESHILVNGDMIKFMARVFFSSARQSIMKVSFNEELRKAKENICFKTETFMKGLGKMVKNMERDSINGLMKLIAKKYSVTKESFNMTILMAWRSYVTLQEEFTSLFLRTVF